MTYYEEKRIEPRKKVCIHAFASDIAETIEVKCVIRDVNSRGCKLVSRDIQELPVVIRITAEKFCTPVQGRIIWRKDNMVGVTFTGPGPKPVEATLERCDVDIQFDDLDDEIMVIQKKAGPPSFLSRMQKFVSVKALAERFMQFMSNWNLLFSKFWR